MNVHCRSMRQGSRGRFAGLVFALLLLPDPVRAAGPVALVESVTGAPAGVEFMDYLSTGQVIALHPKDELVIDYLQSCVRETISDATVTIGTERSTIEGGRVERERLLCDGGRLNLAPEQSRASAGMVSRFMGPKTHPLPPGTMVQRRLYGASPIVDLDGSNRLVVERLDRDENPIDLTIPVDRLLRSRFYDFASDDRVLATGGIYRLTIGDRSMVFQVDRSATSGQMPIVGRLLRF